MASVARGVFVGGLPVDMVVIGMGLAIAVIALDLWLERRQTQFRTPVLALAVGIYLPLELSVPIFFGGLVALWAGRARRRSAVTEPAPSTHGHGLLFAAGLITGEALTGIGMAIPIVIFGRSDILAFWGVYEGNLPGVLLLALVILFLYRTAAASESVGS